MRLRAVYGPEIDLPAFETRKHRIKELARHAVGPRTCDYCFSHSCPEARVDKRSWKDHRLEQHR